MVDGAIYGHQWIGFGLLFFVAIMVVGLAFVVIGLLTNPF